MVWTWLAATAGATDLGTTEAVAFTALDHGAWLGCSSIALSGQEDALGCSALATHVAIATTPVFLTQLQPTDDVGRQRIATAWALYWTGVGVTAAGWATIGVGDDGRFGATVMSLGDIALIGAAGLAARQLVGDQTSAVVVPVATGRF
jgi:hypothetical protein